MKSNVKKILFAVCIVIVVSCIGYIAFYYGRKASNEKIYKEAQKKVEEAVKEQPETPAEPEAETPKEEIPVDFASLQDLNPDIYAWIQIPGTNVNYPIVQSSTDDSYYLDHTIEGNEGYPGSIYTESLNSKDFTDFNTVIYGHDMKDGTMFKDLHKYEDLAFLQENQTVIIYTPEKKLTYKIFAAVVYDDRHILKSYDFSDAAQRQGFLDSISEIRSMNSNVLSEPAVNTDSHILTLSTCIGSMPDNRFVVEAVQVNE